MNILFFHNNCIKPTGGGISRITYNLSKVFVEGGNKVWFLSSERVDEGERLNNQLLFPNLKEVYSEENKAFIIQFCRDNAIDVIINQSALLLSFCKLMSEIPKVKKISVIHSSLFVPYRHSVYLVEYQLRKKGLGFLLPVLKTKFVNDMAVRMMVRKRRLQYQAMVDYSDVVICLTKGQVDDFRLFLTKNDMKKLHVIHNCVELNNTFTLPEKRKKQVLWLGTIDFSIKRTDLILRIWNKVSRNHPDWQLKILGDSPYLSEAKGYAQKIGVQQVEFTGRVNPESYYQESQITCITSTHEAFCMVMLESLKYGLVPMAFDSFPAAKEIIDNGVNGILVTPFSVNEYAKKLDQMMTEDNTREKIQKAALASAKQFDDRLIAKQWLQLIRNM